MSRKFAFFVRMSAAAIVLTAGSTLSAVAQTPPPASLFTLSSPKLQDGATLDKHYAGPDVCGGDNVSLPLQWSNAPADTKSFGIILFDVDSARGLGSVHWIAYGIAPDVKSLAEGEGTNPSPRLTGGSNTRKWATYFGPCATLVDAPHHYVFSIYALDMPKDELPGGLTRDEFLAKTKGHVIAMTSLVAKYKRPK